MRERRLTYEQALAALQGLRGHRQIQPGRQASAQFAIALGGEGHRSGYTEQVVTPQRVWGNLERFRGEKRV